MKTNTAYSPADGKEYVSFYEWMNDLDENDRLKCQEAEDAKEQELLALEAQGKIIINREVGDITWLVEWTAPQAWQEWHQKYLDETGVTIEEQKHIT